VNFHWGERERAKLSICVFIWYMRIPYMHSALFVRDAIFPHVIARYS